MIKPETVKRKIKRIEFTLNRMERGIYVSSDVAWVTDQIAWLWKFRYIDEKTFDDLVNRATSIIKALS